MNKIFGKVFGFSKTYVRAFLNCAYAFTFGSLTEEGRTFVREVYSASFFNGHKGPKAILPKIEIGHVMDNRVLVKVVEPSYVQGNVNLIELMVIDNLIKSSAPKAVFEMGTFDGRTAKNFAVNTDDDCVIYTIDLPDGNPGITRLQIEELDKLFINKEKAGGRIGSEGKIRQLYGDTATFDFAPYYNSMDFVFVDASHSYEYVANDTRMARRLLRNGKGIILWHDYNVSDQWPGLMKALHEFYLQDGFFKNLKYIVGTKFVILDTR